MDMEKTKKEKTNPKKVKWVKEKKEDNGKGRINKKYY